MSHSEQHSETSSFNNISKVNFQNIILANCLPKADLLQYPSLNNFLYLSIYLVYGTAQWGEVVRFVAEAVNQSRDSCFV